MNKLVQKNSIEDRIFLIRGHRVMLSMHLAELYDVEPKVLIQGVKRNAERFPADFMFQLTKDEFKGLKSQFVTSNRRGGIRRATPYAFTQEGVAMLSSVLRSPKAIQVNIAIMRAFVILRDNRIPNRKLVAKLKELERKVEVHDEEIQEIFEAIEDLIAIDEKSKRRIGFHANS